MERNVNKVRLLNAGEIECHVAAVSENGVSLLLYKDARVDQKILDETFGPFGWKRSHQCIDGNLYCTVEIKDAETGDGSESRMWGLPDMPKRKNHRHRTVSSAPASTGASAGSSIRLPLYGFPRQRCR